MSNLAQLTDGVITNLIVVDPDSIPAAYSAWPEVKYQKIGDTYDASVETAGALALTTKEARAFRDSLLSKTDWMATSDRTMTDAQTTYRQALRTIPEQSGFPDNINWPSVPEGMHPD